MTEAKTNLTWKNLKDSLVKYIAIYNQKGCKVFNKQILTKVPVDIAFHYTFFEFKILNKSNVAIVLNNLSKDIHNEQGEEK